MAEEEGTALHLRGSNSLRATAALVAEAFMKETPGAIVVVEGGGTTRGLKALLDGTADLAMTSSALQQGTLSRATAEGVELVRHVVCYNAIAPIVHPDNPVQSVTLRQLEKIFTGRIVNWKTLGGEDQPISTLVHGPASGTQETWRAAVLKPGSVLTPRAEVLNSAKTLKRVAGNRGSIGYVAAALVDDDVRLLAIDGVVATPETVGEGHYPVLQELAVVGRKGEEGRIAPFLRYFLDAEKGQAIVIRVGLSPAPATGEGKP